MKFSNPRKSLLTLCILAASGCAVGPDFKTPAAPQTDRYTAQELPQQTAATDVKGGEAQTFAIGEQLPAQWWTLFGSDKLNTLVQAAFNGSPTSAAARAALRQAQENLNAQRGGFFPSIDANGSAQRQRGAVLAPGLGDAGVYNLYNASVSVAYTLDIFGGVRRGVEARAAAVDSQQFELQATYLTLAANVVTSSVGEAALRDQLAATQDIIKALENQLNIIEQRHQLGAAAFSDVLSARSNLAAVRATLPTYEKQLAAVQNQLAVYLGKLPSDFTASNFDIGELTLPQQLPLNVPSELVRRRPDVRSAEARMHEASAEIGVATANLLPQISLNGSFGSQTTEAAQLFKDKVWSFGAGITQPLFHGGTLTAQRRAAIAAYDQAAANYQNVVLKSFQNVADALSAVHSDAKALQAQYEAMSSAKSSLDLREKQLALGSISFLNLLDAQRQYQQTRINYSQALASRYQDTAALFQALGGDWDDTAALIQPVATAAESTKTPAQQ
ncbi:MAG: efflux system, outer rane lipoprotein NodT family [Verrucomicrobiaceae bacterium]|nr:efflux system, outer rane lipoprotein NodT family [Verrucomicrobiaceae bacterium]